MGSHTVRQERSKIFKRLFARSWWEELLYWIERKVAQC